MKKLISFILFLVYTVAIFFIENIVILGLILLINLILILILKINIKNSMNNLIKLMPFILFTMLINYFFADLKFALLVGIRIILVCNITYTYSKTITTKQFGEIIEKLFYPLKIFKINSKEIGLIVTISISFIPIMKNKLKELRNVLEVKGIKSNNLNLLKNINTIFKPFFVSILQKTNEIEYSVKSKGYM